LSFSLSESFFLCEYNEENEKRQKTNDKRQKDKKNEDLYYNDRRFFGPVDPSGDIEVIL